MSATKKFGSQQKNLIVHNLGWYNLDKLGGQVTNLGL